MTTLARKEIIKLRLEQAFSPSYLEVIDESDKHIGHAGHQGGERHFAIVIKAACFQGLSKVSAHQKVYALFYDMMPNEIHALQIKILI